MRFDSVLCIADPLRNTHIFPEGILDLVREPILQGTGMDIGHPPGSHRPHAFLPGFSLERFRTLASPDGDWASCWASTYFELPRPALEYFVSHIPPGSLLLGLEIPAWLLGACIAGDIPFIDIRTSPLRFGRDLYIALRTNHPDLYRRIDAESVSVEELRLEAAGLAANVRMHRRRLEEAGQAGFSLGRSLVFIGQAPYDGSLLSETGVPLRCEDYLPELMERLDGRRLIHKPHPFSPAFGATERATLEAACGVPVSTCHQNAYQVLTSDDDVELIGLSSGLLQEAAWFKTPAHTLYRPFVPLAMPDEFDLQRFQQVHFAHVCAPGFWHRLLAPTRQAPALDRLPDIPMHFGRQTLDLWWDYSKVLTWQRSLPNESFQRGGGQLLRNELAQLQQTVEQLSQAVNGL